ncbi:two-component regulator propeller domain-containing protein [Fulvivirga kasyanovii]|uniref:histidine kinase n=1 Tax=Fulvivirga kasyanovii TaxID=396812 RepID=A0ABW9RWU4_9BACT|nr:two-component regulator propeller domain-containing protein [Fulvivirga kasyanovii]MTI27485.1 hybrid sensor histidine kinase/response regulator [Fulvivirga kasyanovii]
MHLKKLLLAAFYLYFGIQVCAGQHKELKFKRFNSESGLSSSKSTCFAQTPDGYLWIGTADGLNRFDGHSFNTFRNDPDDSLSLSDNYISTLFVDHEGKLWIGTQNNGLSVYDAKTGTFHNYRSEIHDPSTLSNHYITSITEDADKNLWVGTIMGLNRYDRKQDNFHRYFHEITVSIFQQTIDSLRSKEVPSQVIQGVSGLIGEEFQNERALFRALEGQLTDEQLESYKVSILKYSGLKATADHIRVLEADSIGNLWIGYDKDGLGYFNPKTSRLSTYRYNAKDPYGICSNEISSLTLDDGGLWVGSRDGSLCWLQLPSNQFTYYELPGTSSNIESIKVDSRGTLWVGDGYGLCRYDKAQKKFYRYQHQENDKYSLSSTAVKAIFEDKHNDIWIGSTQGGINLTLGNIPFTHLKHYPEAPGSLSKTSVSSVLEDSKGNIWVGYYAMGLDIYNPVSKEVTHMAHVPGVPGSLGKGTVFEIFEDSKGNIWVGTYEGGLQMFDPASNSFTTYKHDPANPKTISGNDVRAIAEADDGTLWIAVHGQGVSAFDRKKNIFKSYKADYLDWQNSLSNDWVYTLYIDSDQNVWVGSVFGISVLMHGTSHFKSYTKENRNLSHNNVRAILEDTQGNLWIGTDNGLNLFNRETSRFSTLFCKDGLPNNTIHGILEDAQSQLWISTNHGLSKFDPGKGSFTNYDILDGLQSNEFFPGACSKGPSGTFYFGGINGLTLFQPDQIEEDSSAINIKLTGLNLFNSPVKPGQAPLKNTLDQTDHLRLKHDQNMVTFVFSGLEFKNPEKIQYAYMLEGFDNQWNYIGNKKEATYTNLDPGEYTFKVMAASGNGGWHKNVRSLKVTVLHPVWQTIPAYLLYGAIFLALIYYYKQVAVAKERFKNKVELQKMAMKKAHEIDMMKLNFFTSISHEFRTPLTLILDPINRLLTQRSGMSDAEQDNHFKILRSNAQKLLKLVNQVLDISAIDSGQVRLATDRHDVVEFCQSIIETFSFSASLREIELRFSCNKESEYAFFDADILEKAITNLLSNALKFTQKTGRVSLQVLLTDQNNPECPDHIKTPSIQCQFIKLTVADNGPGIAKEHQAKIFEKFFKAQNHRSGSGIGLALTKQLVEHHYGAIEVQSQQGEGSKFTIWIPVSQERFAPGEIVRQQGSDQCTRGIFNEEISWKNGEIAKSEPVSGRPTLLLVEDNDDLRKYVKMQLRHEYLVYETDSAENALKLAAELNPDLIIADVMLPCMNGLELCHKIKSNTSTSHLPVILLTSRASSENELEGFQTGASDYISKPFDVLLLKARIKNVLALKQPLKDKLNHDPDFEPLDIVPQSLQDKGFFQELVKTIHEHIADEGFSPEKLADKMNLSRSQLYKKVKGLTGLSVSILIRNIRLKKASKLLKTQDLSISEVAYEVGFSDPGYFTKCFKEMYSCPPSEYLNSH